MSGCPAETQGPPCGRQPAALESHHCPVGCSLRTGVRLTRQKLTGAALPGAWPTQCRGLQAAPSGTPGAFHCLLWQWLPGH